jgi:hypothetical protein
VEIDRVRVDAEDVAGVVACDLCRRSTGHGRRQPTQSAQQRVEHVAGTDRWFLIPHAVDGCLDRNGSSHVDDQCRQHGLVSRGSYVEGMVSGLALYLPEKPESHAFTLRCSSHRMYRIRATASPRPSSTKFGRVMESVVVQRDRCCNPEEF